MPIFNERNRRLATFTRRAQPWIDRAGLLALIAFFISLLPLAVLNPLPATGGDMGSHYWPVYVLKNFALPSGMLRVWSPGNLGGEPLLLHYFPLPFMIMALIGYLLPLGMAFNLGTLLPIALLPLCVYWCVRGFGLRFPAPLLAAAASLPFIYNESFAMWGGNTLSTLAGQFAHGYAINFYLLGIGRLAYELRTNRWPLLSSFLFGCVIASHGYIMLGLPFVSAGLLIAPRFRSARRRITLLAVNGVFAACFGLWHLLPTVLNSPWTTAFIMIWISPNIWAESAPPIFYPVLLLLVLALSLIPLLLRRRPALRRRMLGIAGFWAITVFGYWIYYFAFPYMGLVDVRAIPQMELAGCILSGSLVGLWLHRWRLIGLFSAVLLTAGSMWWSDKFISNFPGWAEWNYSGWESKNGYPDLLRLSEHLKGDLAMPRVVYEHNTLNNNTGTERVFEMLPYFAQRATLESLYIQASILAPEIFYVQANVSKTPSCPFVQYECGPYNLAEAEARLRLMGVGELIMLTEELRAQADQAAYLRHTGEFGQWHTYKLEPQPSLAGVFNTAPRLSTDPYWQGRYKKRIADPLPRGGQTVEVDPQDWKDLFYSWFRRYDGSAPMIVVDRGEPELQGHPQGEPLPESVWVAGEECRPEAQATFDSIKLTTNCPGKAHYLKFSYHAAWKSLSGERLFLVSPGFLALIPTGSEVILRFVWPPLWAVASAVSVLAHFVLIGWGLLRLIVVIRERDRRRH